jgi:hypothetical protein
VNRSTCPERLRERSEAAQRFVNEGDQFVQGLNDWFSLTRPMFRKRYEKGELLLHIHVRTVLSEFEAYEFCAVCERDALGMRASDTQILDVNLFAAALADTGDVQCNELNRTTDKRKQFVFVPNVEVVQQPKWVEHPLRIPSRIRLQLLNECHRGLPEGAFLSFPSGLLLSDGFGGRWLGSPTIPDRKFGGTRGIAVIDQLHLPGSEVERGSQVVHDIADNQAPVLRNRAGHTRAPYPLASLRVVISDDAVWIESSKLRMQSYQVLEVLFGPLNLGSAASQVWWWHA